MRPAYPDVNPPIFGHPLRVLPWLRNQPQSFGRDLLYTLALAGLATIIFTVVTASAIPRDQLLAALPRLLLVNSVMSLLCGYGIHFVSIFVGQVILRRVVDISVGARSASMIAAAIFGGAAGYWLGAQILGLPFRVGSGTFLASMAATAVMIGVAIPYRLVMLSELQAERERSGRLQAERLMTLARLQTLQAQIEPHFLFNTLANVSSLIECDPKAARTMLDEFTLLLRASLDQTRNETTTLRTELRVVEAYLAVLRVRMGERLSYAVHVEPTLLDLNVPSMLLQPIVENAVKHGIEPRLQGGIVRIEVQQTAAGIALIVADNGIGFAPSASENVGLGAVRERLAMQFADRATLNIERNSGWTQVSIHIPMPA